MATVAVLQTDLLLNSAAFRTGMVAAAQTATTTLGQIQAEAQKTAASIDLMSKAAGAFIGFEAIKEGVSALIEAQIQMQQIHFTLVSATGSANGAADAFDFLKQKSAELGLNLQPAAQAFGQLAAAASASGIPMEQAQKLFTSFGEASTTLHLSSEQSQHALLALTEMMSRGTIQARQLNQQLGFAIPGSAARFKSAVMEAIKGTDLAGQSFEQLEKKGELVTARFMPQLIQALAESGRGYKEAAQGLNAQINRLKTSWFDLKNDMSSGLFNDAATSGIALVAQNMERIATSATIVGGLAVARLLGGQVDKGVSGISSAVRRRQELAEQAAAAVQLTDAEVAETAAQVRNNEVALAGVTTARNQALAARQTATAMYEQALAENAAAQATLEHQRNAMTLSANIRAEAIATAQAEAAQIALNKAQAQYDASIAASNALKEQQIIIDGRLLELRAANTAAIEAQTVANEAQAATGIGATLGRGLASAGSGLLALAGGPWGVALAAIGGVSYAIYELRKRSDEFDASVKTQINSLSQLDASLSSTKAAYDDLANRPLFATLQSQLTNAEKLVADSEAKMAELRQKYAEAADENMRRNARSGGGDSPEMIKLRQQMDDLAAAAAPAEGTLQELRREIADQMRPAVANLATDFDNAGTAWGKFMVALGASQELKDAEAKIVSAQSAVQAKITELQAQTLKAKAANDTFGMSPAQKLAADQKQFDQANKAAGSVMLGQADAAYQAAAAEERRAEALKAGAEAAKKAAAEAKRESDAYTNLDKSIREKIAAQQEEKDGGSKLTDADKNLLKVKEDLITNLKNLSPLQKQQLLNDAQTLVNLTNENAARKKKNDELQRESVLQDKLNAQRALQDKTNARALEGVGHGAQWNAEQAEFEKLQDQYDRDKAAQGKLFEEGSISADEYAQSIGAIQSAYSTAVVAQQKFYAAQHLAQANWKNGAQTAFENFRDTAANVASQTETLFTNAFNGMTDALTTFATTGKLNFKGFVSSVLTDLTRMELRIVESKILQSIFAALMPSGGGTFSNSSAIGGDSIGGGGFNFAAVSGGRAGGGPVSAGSLYQVNEKGPELLTTGGATYLMMGGQGGTVTPNGGVMAGSGGGGITVNTTVVVQSNGQATSKTDTSGADKAAMGKQIGDMVKGAVVETVTRMTQPGGLLWRQRVGQTA